MTFQVLDKPCDQCLYGKNRIVSDERFEELKDELARKDSHFICHKASLLGLDVCCRGDWNARSGGQLGRIMDRLNAVKFITEEEMENGRKRRRARQQEK
jgi:hypothetical protein